MAKVLTYRFLKKFNVFGYNDTGVVAQLVKGGNAFSENFGICVTDGSTIYGSTKHKMGGASDKKGE